MKLYSLKNYSDSKRFNPLSFKKYFNFVHAYAKNHILENNHHKYNLNLKTTHSEIEKKNDEKLSPKTEFSKILKRPYKYGFISEIEQNLFSKGLNESTIHSISRKKREPEWLLDFRLRAYRKWLTMEEPSWSDNKYSQIDYQTISYYAEPKTHQKKSIDEVDPELLTTFKKLGISLSDAVKTYPQLVQKYLGSVVSMSDNYFAALNS